MTPVGIDEGETVEDRFEIVENCIDFLKRVGKKPKIAILAEGRKDDFGRGEEVSKSITESEKLTKLMPLTSSLPTSLWASTTPTRTRSRPAPATRA